MILVIRHKGLRLLHEQMDSSKVPFSQHGKLRIILTRLEAAESPQDMDQPGYNFRSLSGNLKGFYSVKVNKNFRVIFRFEDHDVTDVDYLDYH